MKFLFILNLWCSIWQEVHNIAWFSQSRQQKPLNFKGTICVPQVQQNYTRSISVSYVLKFTFPQLIYGNERSELKRVTSLSGFFLYQLTVHWPCNKGICFFSFPLYSYLLPGASGWFHTDSSWLLLFWKVSPPPMLPVITGKGRWFSKAPVWCLVKLLHAVSCDDRGRLAP